MKILMSFVLLSVSTSLWASLCSEETFSAPQSKEEYCAQTLKEKRGMLCEYENMLGHNNQGGLFGLPTGVCWWHSQFHRNLTYLAYYCPECTRPDLSNKKEVRKLHQLIRSVMKRQGTVEIKGFANAKAFTSHPVVAKVLQKELQKWMGRDSFLHFTWVRGLEGKAPNTHYLTKLLEGRGAKYVERQEYELEQVYKTILEERIAYVMWQLPGVDAHAALIVDMQPLPSGGYKVWLQDSNYQERYLTVNGQQRVYTTKPREFYWQNGGWYTYGGRGPYSILMLNQLNQDRYFKKIERAFAKTCGKAL